MFTNNEWGVGGAPPSFEMSDRWHVLLYHIKQNQKIRQPQWNPWLSNVVLDITVSGSKEQSPVLQSQKQQSSPHHFYADSAQLETSPFFSALFTEVEAFVSSFASSKCRDFIKACTSAFARASQRLFST